jgi:enoyl-CoA hydratase/carnithine racemase
MTQPQTDTVPGLRLVRHGRVAQVTLSNPTQRNALTRAMFDQGLEIFRALKRDAQVGAVVVCGEGDHFCGGGNIRRMVEQRDKPPHTQSEHVDVAHAWLMAMRECPQPIIAAVEGAAAGGGLGVALACDLLVAAENATLVMSYAKIGLSPDCGTSHWLARALPHQLMLEMFLDAQPMPAARLHQLGVVNRVCAPGTAFEHAMQWAKRLADGPAAAQGRIKRLAYAAQHNSLSDQLDDERDTLIESMYSDECGEGINAFLGKRPPKFQT